MKTHVWKKVINSASTFIIVGVIILGLAAGSVVLNPNIAGVRNNQVSSSQSSSSFPPPSSFGSSSISSSSTISSSSQSSSQLSSSATVSTAFNATSTTSSYSSSSTTYYTTSSQRTSTTVSTSTTTSNVSLVLAPTSGPPGSEFTFTFNGGKAETLYYEQSFYGQNMSFTTSPNGSFTGAITVPSSEHPHEYAIRIKDSNRNIIVEATFTVTNTTTTSTTTTFSTNTASSSATSRYSSTSIAVISPTNIAIISATIGLLQVSVGLRDFPFSKSPEHSKGRKLNAVF
jgi:hypothetical protein